MKLYPGAIDTTNSLLNAVNNLKTTLNGPLAADANGNNGSATEITVASTTGFPSSGFILVDVEVISYTGTTATKFTGITRTQDGTVTAVHSNGANIMNAVIAAYHNTLRDVVIEIEDYALTGWVAAGETWTYVSPSTFLISGDKTSKYSVGMKIKLTQTTIKYFYITDISYSAPNTIVIVYGGTDYSLANAVIIIPCFSTNESPFAFPNYFNWTGGGIVKISGYAMEITGFKDGSGGGGWESITFPVAFKGGTIPQIVGTNDAGNPGYPMTRFCANTGFDCIISNNFVGDPSPTVWTFRWISIGILL